MIRIEQMSISERRAAAEKGGDTARKLDEWTAERLDYLSADLTPEAVDCINTFSSINGDFYLTFGELTPEEINVMVREWGGGEE